MEETLAQQVKPTHHSEYLLHEYQWESGALLFLTKNVLLVMRQQLESLHTERKTTCHVKEELIFNCCVLAEFTQTQKKNCRRKALQSFALTRASILEPHLKTYLKDLVAKLAHSHFLGREIRDTLLAAVVFVFIAFTRK